MANEAQQMKEIWKPIKNYEGLYEISNFGNVKSLHYRRSFSNENLLRPRNGGEGYLIVGLHKEKKHKNFYIHRLVAYHFIPNPDNLPEINHKDENRKNNMVSNLEWCTSKYNKNYGHRAEKMVLSKDSRYIGENACRKSPVICIETGEYFPTMRQAAIAKKVSYSKISNCCSGKRKQTGGFHWKYATG